MREEFLTKLKSGAPCCYMRLWPEDLKMWNFTAEPLGLFNTRLLFQAAAHPHFDYFFEQIDYFGMDRVENLDLIDEENFKSQVGQKKSVFFPPTIVNSAVVALFKEKKFNCVIISDGRKPTAAFSSVPVINLKGLELFGNVEPVWLDLKKRLPKQVDVFLLALGPEKFLIGPRLKLAFGKPAIDIASPENLPKAHKLNSFKAALKKFIRP